MLASTPVADRTVASPLVGRWEGNARIVVQWVKRPRMEIDLTVRADGAVHGKMGDATLTGHLKRNRGPLGRARFRVQEHEEHDQHAR